MRLLIKNKFFSLKGNSYVRDENDNNYLKVKGKFFSFTNKKFITDLEGNVLYIVRNKYWTFLRKKAIIYEGQSKKKLGTISSTLRLRADYTFDGFEDQYEIKGQIIARDYEIHKNGELLGTISRRLLSLTDTFALDIPNEEDAAFFVAVVIAIDNIIDQYKDTAISSSIS